MTIQAIPPHPYSPDCEYLRDGHCYRCCDRCNYDRHQCAGCGEDLDHNGLDSFDQKHEGCVD